MHFERHDILNSDGILSHIKFAIGDAFSDQPWWFEFDIKEQYANEVDHLLKDPTTHYARVKDGKLHIRLLGEIKERTFPLLSSRIEVLNVTLVDHLNTQLEERNGEIHKV